MEYFMDQMENWELYELYQTIEYADSNNWEQTRAMMYVIAQVNSKKKLSPEDIMKFPWENKGTTPEKDRNISNEDIERIKKLSEQYIKQMKS